MDALDKLLFELKTISEIQKNTRISTSREFIVIESPSMLQWLYRSYNHDDRERAAKRVASVITSVAFISDLMIEIPKKHDDDLHRIQERLTTAQIGITNLIETYKDDQNFIGIIRPTVSQVVRQIGKLENYFGDID